MNQIFLISWNVRGLNKQEKKAAVRRIISKSGARICFLQETKLCSVDIRSIRQINGYASNMKWISSPSAGSAGGLISPWDPMVFDCNDSIVNDSYICLIGNLNYKDFSSSCVLVNVYASNGPSERKVVFNNLQEDLSQFSKPIIMGGDFNITQSPLEKLGSHPKKGEMQIFSDFIDSLCLIDLPLKGGTYTWSNFREKPSMSRLDRFLISPEILGIWPDLIQSALHKNISDHNPIVLSMVTQDWGPKPFRWFDVWTKDKDLMASIGSICSVNKGRGICSML
ncbi:hypothetical protein HRI_004417800 [Hibiscus trionum]|uniref:Endonuclease/exonuclease/phosphatase domain-containing protein n=1 Tax=Hibiscus trionum TaxID=183268 RepID=A0A9W7J3X3_HIBTR|nr:hypothetical protein HRI_004417800 [Hibiscus trionum]